MAVDMPGIFLLGLEVLLGFFYDRHDKPQGDGKQHHG